MSLDIELFRGESLEAAGTLPLGRFVQATVEHMLGKRLNGATIHLTVLGVPDESILPGTPLVYNLLPDYGYVQVSVVHNGSIIYKHPHSIEDILTQQLQTYLRSEYPEEARWGFRIRIPGLPATSAFRRKPQVEGAVAVRPFGPGEQPGFTIKRLEEEPPPPASLADFGITVDPSLPKYSIGVLISPSLEREFRTRELSQEVEEGGFLVGRLYLDANNPGAYLLHIIVAPAAEHTGASLLHFTFTGDSFAAIKRWLRERRSTDRIVGWYHTHLFPATDTMGLSTIDFKLHFGTFTNPWQVAGLINLDGEKRVLRFYARQGQTMVLCPHWVTHEQQ